MPDDRPAAATIYQALLDNIGETIRDGDFATYSSFVALPHAVETFEAKLTLETQSDLRGFFDQTRKRLAQLDVEGLTRTCTVADYIDDMTIRGCHETRLINGNLVIVESYMAMTTLQKRDGVWRARDSQFAENTPSIPSRALRAKGARISAIR